MKTLWLLLGFWVAAVQANCQTSQPTDTSWHSGKGFRWKDLSTNADTPAPSKMGFSLLDPASTGVLFTNRVEDWQAAFNRVLWNGSGLAIGDFDNDGLPDLFFCSLTERNVLYRNLGHWKFKDVTAESGVDLKGRFFRGATFADIDGDGALDLLITATGRGVTVLKNDGHGHFQDVSDSAGTRSRFGSTTVALADVDGNGTVDLYVANNRTDDIRDQGQVKLSMVKGRPMIPPHYQERLTFLNGELVEYGETDQLYLNDGHGHFSPVNWTGGQFLDEQGVVLKQPPLDWGLSAAFHDLNEDGAPDLYVCNDYWTPDRIWINDGRGHFRAMDLLALRNTPASSMGIDFADADGDGHVDMLVVDMLSRDPVLRKRQLLAQNPAAGSQEGTFSRPQIMRNTFQHNRGDGTFEEIAYYSGLAASEWSWQPIFIDVDLDGAPDLLITSGHPRDVQDMDANRLINQRQRPYDQIQDPIERRKIFTSDLMENSRLYPALNTPVLAFRNEGALRFRETTQDWGTQAPAVHHGIALADLDGDGDLDFVVNNLGTVAGVYRNESTQPRIQVRLIGKAPNTQAIGALVRCRVEGLPLQSHEITVGGKYQSGSDPTWCFATGNSGKPVTLDIQWRDGTHTVLSDAKPNRLYEVREEDSIRMSSRPGSAPVPHTLFQNLSTVLEHTHREDSFDDFSVQTLLPRKLSEAGPGVTWIDRDRTESPDLMVGAGRGSSLARFRMRAQGSWETIPLPEPNQSPLSEDSTSLVSLGSSSKPSTLLVGLAGYEQPVASAVIGIGNDPILFQPPLTNSGPIAVADINGDGRLEVFIAGGTVLGRYPLASPSRIYRKGVTAFELDPENTRALEKVGRVEGAIWTDLDADGFPELVLACDWGPVRIFKNNAGRLIEATQEWAMDGWTGLWKGIAAGDIDGDGRLDLVVANEGLNSPYAASEKHPLLLYACDYAARGIEDLIETEYDFQRDRVQPRRYLDDLAQAFPFLRERFPTYAAYSQCDVSDILKDLPPAPETKLYRSTTLETTLFLNRGNHFDRVPLPKEAQWSPAFGVNIADFDGNGTEDIFLSQNCSGLQSQMSPMNAGLGLLLLNQTSPGNAIQLRPVPSQESGIRSYGNQRGSAVADFDGDGRIDIAIGQNQGPTQLYRNQSAQPGLRIRLSGPPENPQGIGAVLQWQSASHSGPAHEIHGGSGYRSQDSSVCALSVREQGASLRVLWPGGKVSITPIPADAHSIEIGFSKSSNR